MRFMPVFLDLTSGTVALIGSGAAAASKLRLLRSAGANVRWYAGNGDETAQALAQDISTGEVELARGDPLQVDLGEFIAVVAASGGALDAQVAQRARRKNIPVNVVDGPDLSTFIFPAVVDRGEVIVAIGTGGASPVLARRLRERIEAVLPARIGDLAALMGRFRGEFARLRHASCSPRRFWESVVDGPIATVALAGGGQEAEAALARAIESTRSPERKSGAVFLVGAGPGDPDLLTLRGLQALQGADIVFYDEIVTPEILDRARRDAKLVFAGKKGRAQAIDDAHLIVRMLAAAQQGLNAVRLNGGDSFGFDAEQIQYFARAGVRVIVVPGVTAHTQHSRAVAA
jgi:uroporphyrin-III C-methyltransferase / precorrin-2 dehydrogenase / sirohydrochlorin ferrochelatase